jgi:hypothetical protein
MTSFTLYEAYSKYCEYLKSIKSHVKIDPTACLNTALFRYTLPGYGLPINASKNQAIAYMKKISLAEFKDALNVQQNVYDSLGGRVSSGIQRTYRSALKKMLSWCSQQSWWRVEANSPTTPFTPRRKKSFENAQSVRVTDRKKKPNYGLTQVEIKTASLAQELEQFYNFMTEAHISDRKSPPIRDVTAKSYIQLVKLMLGWTHRYRKNPVPLKELSLKTLVKSSCVTVERSSSDQALREDIQNIQDYLEWLYLEREVSPRYQQQTVLALIWVASFLYHQLFSSDAPRSNTRRARLRTLPINEELRRLVSKLTERARETPKVASEEKKWIDWSEFLAVVQQLKVEYHSLLDKGEKASPQAKAAALQRYLIFALFSIIPDRQRTFRELSVGVTLCKSNNVWQIEHSAKDFKTGHVYLKPGEKRIIPIPEFLYPELENWLFGTEDEAGSRHCYVDAAGLRLGWREVFQPKHNFVFTQQNGEPFITSTFNSLFRNTAYRLTGKVCTPQLVRQMIVTHFKLSGAPEHIMTSLAQLMTMSPQMQQRVYDRQASAIEGIAPAIHLLAHSTGSVLASANQATDVLKTTDEQLALIQPQEALNNLEYASEVLSEEASSNQVSKVEVHASYGESVIPQSGVAITVEATDQLYPLLINAKVLDGETSRNAIAQEICNQIYFTAFPEDDEIPEVSNAPQLRRLIPQFKKRLSRRNLALILLPCQPTTELIRLLEQLTDVLFVGIVTLAPIYPPLHRFSPTRQGLAQIIQSWINQISQQLSKTNSP